MYESAAMSTKEHGVYSLSLSDDKATATPPPPQASSRQATAGGEGVCAKHQHQQQPPEAAGLSDTEQQPYAAPSEPVTASNTLVQRLMRVLEPGNMGTLEEPAFGDFELMRELEGVVHRAEVRLGRAPAAEPSLLHAASAAALPTPPQPATPMSRLPSKHGPTGAPPSKMEWQPRSDNEPRGQLAAAAAAAPASASHQGHGGAREVPCAPHTVSEPALMKEWRPAPVTVPLTAARLAVHGVPSKMHAMPAPSQQPYSYRTASSMRGNTEASYLPPHVRLRLENTAVEQRDVRRQESSQHKDYGDTGSLPRRAPFQDGTAPHSRGRRRPRQSTP